MASARSPKIGKPKTRNGTDWIVPAPLVDKLIPGDQLAWAGTQATEIHEVMALISLAGVPVAILREPAPTSAPEVLQGSSHELTTFTVAAAHGEFRLTVVEPARTGRVWMFTDTQILLTQESHK